MADNENPTVTGNTIHFETEVDIGLEPEPPPPEPETKNRIIPIPIPIPVPLPDGRQSGTDYQPTETEEGDPDINVTVR